MKRPIVPKVPKIQRQLKIRFHFTGDVRQFFSSIHRNWCLIFLVWLLLISGVFSHLFSSRTGNFDGPGFLQAIYLQRLLQQKQNDFNSLKSEVIALREQARRLTQDPKVQEAEIRKTLGYAAKDEIVFDF